LYICPYTRKEYRYGPPAGWVMKGGQYSIGPQDWDLLVARGLKFEPYDGPRFLSKTFGDCLWPLLGRGGEYLELRPMAADEPLVDNGLYVVEPENQEEMRQLIKDRLGRLISGRVSISKFLRWVGTEWWYINREGIDPLCNGIVTHEVVGVVPFGGPKAGISSTPRTDGTPPVYFENSAIAAGIRRRAVLAGAAASAAVLLTGCGDKAADAPKCNRQPFAADSPECFQIGLNAATQLVVNNNNSSASGITGITGLSNLGVTVSNTGPVVSCTVIVTATIQARQTVGTLGDVKLLLQYKDNPGGAFVPSSQELKIVSASFQTYTLQWQFSHSAVNAGVSGQAAIYSDSGSTSDSYDWQLATLQMEYVLR
jgi:hypothetical protein